jgi:hypothetical protein
MVRIKPPRNVPQAVAIQPGVDHPGLGVAIAILAINRGKQPITVPL